MNVIQAQTVLAKADGWGPEAVGAMTDDEVLYEAARVMRLNGRDEADYKRMYNKGWRRSERVGSIPDSANAEDDAWMDGYLDNATGREKWHLLFCPDHDSCP